ncbi:ATPase [Streptomyces sp. P38-E01]|uniref:ATPase n=1 Tax=Streptomyces tardus TaxID=2780544 RepID=A0A949N3N0_9ACTN|nr:BadF/BadG/BcrA/BcrD ATPase family protein [Streptomyces tardus]MBU7600215.1 ATPase [Streptomyces tardus]
MSASWVLGVDSGGSGLRIALARAETGTGARSGGTPARAPEPVGRVHRFEPLRTGSDGIDSAQLLDRLLPSARGLLAEAGAERPEAVCIGAAGMATLGDGLRGTLPGALRRELGVVRLALAADTVAGYAAALGEEPGAVVAAGTGMMALGTDLRQWRRADGWGHLLGDCGGGAWIGRAGLECAMRAHDGRTGGSAALLARAERRFGPAGELPGQLYPRTDRPAVLASFAPDVADLAASGDPRAISIMSGAAEEIAVSAVAAMPALPSARLALTGGLLELGEALTAPLLRQLAERLPDTAVSRAEGQPLAGALRLAAALPEGRLRLPVDGRLLSVF